MCLVLKSVIIMIIDPFLFSAKNRKCSHHVCDYFVSPVQPNAYLLFSFSLQRCDLLFFCSIIFCVWKGLCKDDVIFGHICLSAFSFERNQNLATEGK